MTPNKKRYYFIIKDKIRKKLKTNSNLFKNINTFINRYSRDTFYNVESNTNYAINFYKDKGYNLKDLQITETLELTYDSGTEYCNITLSLIIKNKHTEHKFVNSNKICMISLNYTKNENEFNTKLRKNIETFMEDSNKRNK